MLQDRLEGKGSPDIPVVVVTHHGPSRLSIAPQYEGHPLNPCFVSDLLASFFERPVLWIHGHVHNSLDYQLGNARVVANPRGYRRRGGFENDAFDPAMVIEVPGSACDSGEGS